MAEIAEAADIPYRTYQDIEGGERWPRVENLEAIAGALGVAVTELLADSRKKPTPSADVLAKLERLLSAIRQNPVALDAIMAVVSENSPRVTRLLSAIDADPTILDSLEVVIDASPPAEEKKPATGRKVR